MLPPTLAGGILPQPNGHSAQMTSGASACNPMAPPSGAAPLTAGPNGDIVLSNCTMPTSLYAMQFPGMDGSLSGKNSLALSSNGSFPAGVASFFQPSTKGQELSASQSQPTGVMSFPSMLQSNVSIVSAGTDPAVMQGQTLWGPMSDILAGWNGNTGSSLPINQSPTTEMPTHAHPRQLSMRSLRDRHLDHHRSANNTCHPDHQDSVDGDETDVMQLLTEETEALEDGHVFHPCQVMPSAGSSNRSPTPVLASQRLQPLLPAVMSSSVVAEALSAGDQSGQGHLHTGSECSTDPGDGLRGAPQLGGIPAAESAGTRHLDPHLEPVLSMFRSMIVSNNNAGIQASHPINLVDQHNAVLVSGMPSIARRPTAAFTGNGVSPHSSPSATLRQDDSQFEESVGSAGRAETIRVSQAAAATSSAVLYDQTNNLCSIGLDSTADESQKALKRRNPAATYNGVGALQQRVDGDGCISVVDPQRRKLRIPLSAIRPTKALNGRLTIPSLCLLYQSDRCRQDSNCYQVHADPAVIRQLRQQVIEVPCCCATHGDGNQHMLMECPNTEGRSISLNNGQTIISLSYLAYTTGLKQLIKDARQSVPINPLSLCRLHGSSEGCRFGADCKFIHMCKQIHNQIAATTAQPQLQPQLPTMSPPVVVGNPGHRTLGGTMSSTASSQMLSPTTSSMNGMMLTGGGSPPAGAIPRVTSATSLGSSHGGTTAYNSSFGAPMGTPMAPNVSDRFATQGAVTVGSPGLSNFPTSVGAAMPMAQQRMMFMPTGPSPPPPGTMPTSNLSGQVLWLPRGNAGPGGTSTSGGSAPAPPPQQQYLLPRMNPDGSVMLVPLFMPGGSGPQPPQC